MTMLSPDKTSVINGVTVKEYLLDRHNVNNISLPPKRVKKLKGITIHNTDKIAVKNTTMSEQYTRATVNGNMGSVRVHYYVDDTEAWQGLSLDMQSWHAADGDGDGNTATISIECIMSDRNADKKAVDNTARLTAYLLDTYGLTTADVYTHTYWLNVRDGRGEGLCKDNRCCLAHPYKVCPAYIIPHWTEFLRMVEGYRKKSEAMYYVQVGAFSDRANAERFLETVKGNYPQAFIKAVK